MSADWLAIFRKLSQAEYPCANSAISAVRTQVVEITEVCEAGDAVFPCAVSVPLAPLETPRRQIGPLTALTAHGQCQMKSPDGDANRLNLLGLSANGANGAIGIGVNENAGSANANDTLEPMALTLDGEDLATAPRPSCGGITFHQAPGAPWRCSACEPADEPPSAGWQFCGLPQAADDRAEQAGGVPIPEPAPEAEPLPWTDDRGWIARWCAAGPTLPAREAAARAWIAAAPAEPLPRCLAAVELRRIAAQHGLRVEVGP
jgi:hypothetical protein